MAFTLDDLHSCLRQIDEFLDRRDTVRNVQAPVTANAYPEEV